ncbi:MAG TPA: ATPase domain-containing protein, partial [Actinopolymorphaceae bacterium]
MSKSRAAKASRPAYRCVECGWQTAKWVGRCAECQAWSTVEEVGAPKAPTTTARPVTAPAKPIGEIDVEAARSELTGVPEFDRVLGGGLVRGGVVLLAGEPGVGKSTLLLELAAEHARQGRKALY